jgi:Na+-driven multidrug efflux pump
MGMGFMGFWYGNVFAGYIPFVIGGIYFWSGLWRKRKTVIENSKTDK